MRISFSACKQAQPVVNFPGGLNMEPFIPRRRKDKVVIVMGATGTGKSRLSIELATRFPAEIINSDKMQVYKGLDIVTNKVTEEECQGVPHHLLGLVDPNVDFTAVDFRHHALQAVESITRRDGLPIIAGGSNSFLKALINDDVEFRSRYECCFLWVDVSLPVLYSFVSDRVDRMVEGGLVDEVRQFFDPDGGLDYSKGLRRAIGVPELDRFLRAESNSDDETLKNLVELAIEEIKENTCKLACRQFQNIIRLKEHLGWNMHRLDATEAFLKLNSASSDEAWERLVARPSFSKVRQFLYKEDFSPSSLAIAPVIGAGAVTVAAVTN